ncbi:hypothetical protein [Pseudanabaena yagii]|uniref:Uncharacterized protein n=1 Tax=Pseudanabaena yagii GIHE-NHR1 TaxID=2722753 RepID=A0ABX1LZS3_9CYAN|nr:hypothetical protein [Pseudanabaena yagii]NMF60748.1 hypothetical protein [Pseudanabaena yagii GIHE-NHR1]
MVIVETAIIVFFEGEDTNNNDVTLIVTMRSHFVTESDPNNRSMVISK